MAPEQLLMNDRILNVNTTGGAWGLGTVESEKKLRPDDWYFTCHFYKDPVMAGSLIAEGCVQLHSSTCSIWDCNFTERQFRTNFVFPKLSGAEGRSSHLTH